ncbi:hypothetical protein LguiA_010181 [Lonicera macranthoides]
MGSSSSRMGRGSPPSSQSGRLKRRFSSLICGCGGGASTSHPLPSQVEECPQKSPISYVENRAPVSDVARSSITKSSSISSSQHNSKFESGSSSESSDETIRDTFLENGLQSTETSSHETHISKSKESVSKSKELVSQPVSSDCNCMDAYKEQPSQDLVSSNSTARSVAPIEAHNSMNGSLPLICPEHQHSSHGDSPENPRDPLIGSNSADSGSVLVVSDTVLSLQLLGNDTPRSTTPPSGSRLLLSDGEVHVDVVSISSNILSSSAAEISNREARRNSRRLFWDALSRHSFQRYRDSPTIVFTTGHADDLGSRDRWLLDLSGDLHYDGLGHGFDYPSDRSISFGYPGSRSHHRNERRRALRSEMSERVFRGLDEQGQTTFCASGLHPDGTCSCESFFMAEETSALASISRIVMLAEALFEVMDEIHRQPLSLSLSMLSLPAPESVVDSFPLKSHKKLVASENGPVDVQQCYICLSEYEEGDKVRILPCHHEYHMSCVDKWLKEINGVCPVCRCNVCEGGEQGSVSNTETPVQ